MSSDVIITVFSLIAGALLACFSGIVVNNYTDKRKEKRKYSAFILEFRLRINALCDHIDNFQNALDKGYESIGYFETHLVKNPIFHQYRMISEIPGIDIEKYYESISILEKIDMGIDHPKMKENKVVMVDPQIIKQYRELNVQYLFELKKLLSGLK